MVITISCSLGSEFFPYSPRLILFKVISPIYLREHIPSMRVCYAYLLNSLLPSPCHPNIHRPPCRLQPCLCQSPR